MHPNFREGHSITFDVDENSAEITRYSAVKLTGPRTVALTDTAGEDYLGIAGGDESSGIIQVAGGETRKVAVRLKGAGNANVAATFDPNGDGTSTGTAVEAPATLVPSGNPGELRPIEAGEEAPEGIDSQLLAGTDADGFGLVLIR